jgi:hypothetical protein
MMEYEVHHVRMNRISGGRLIIRGDHRERDPSERRPTAGLLVGFRSGRTLESCEWHGGRILFTVFVLANSVGSPRPSISMNTTALFWTAMPMERLSEVAPSRLEAP